jgi:hypothetical protein
MEPKSLLARGVPQRLSPVAAASESLVSADTWIELHSPADEAQIPRLGDVCGVQDSCC